MQGHPEYHSDNVHFNGQLIQIQAAQVSAESRQVAAALMQLGKPRTELVSAPLRLISIISVGHSTFERCFEIGFGGDLSVRMLAW